MRYWELSEFALPIEKRFWSALISIMRAGAVPSGRPTSAMAGSGGRAASPPKARLEWSKLVRKLLRFEFLKFKTSVSPYVSDVRLRVKPHLRAWSLRRAFERLRRMNTTIPIASKRGRIMAATMEAPELLDVPPNDVALEVEVPEYKGSNDVVTVPDVKSDDLPFSAPGLLPVTGRSDSELLGILLGTLLE